MKGSLIHGLAKRCHKTVLDAPYRLAWRKEGLP
jgi:hypothetical protein